MTEWKLGNFIYDDDSVSQYVGTSKKVDVPEGISSIGPYAFISCDSLEEVELPSTVIQIGARAFADCPHLNMIYISSLFLPKIADDAFLGTNIEFLLTADGENHVRRYKCT